MEQLLSRKHNSAFHCVNHFCFLISMLSSSQYENPNYTECIVIGAGISGLIAANVLQHAGISVSILDKGKAVGGRLATRRVRSPSIGESIFDYGVQLFAASRPEFQSMIDEWQQLGQVTEWGTQIYNSGKICYRGVESNRSLASFLAKGLVVHHQSQVIRMQRTSSCWYVHTKDGREFKCRSLIITCPIPQALDLFKQSNITLPSDLLVRLENVLYFSCIACLALLDKESNLPEPGGIRLDGKSVAWLACNRQKGISKSNAMTILSTPEFSMLYWDDYDSQIASLMIDSSKPFLDSAVLEAQVHRWRFSQPSTFFGECYLTLREPGLLIMAGDAFSSTESNETVLNLERAALSGFQAAKHYIKHQEDYL